VSHITDLFEGHNFNRHKDSLIDYDNQKLPKRVGDVSSILFTIHCKCGWFDELNFALCTISIILKIARRPIFFVGDLNVGSLLMYAFRSEKISFLPGCDCVSLGE
jgi:hypothetical protein